MYDVRNSLLSKLGTLDVCELPTYFGEMPLLSNQGIDLVNSALCLFRMALGLQWNLGLIDSDTSRVPLVCLKKTFWAGVGASRQTELGFPASANTAWTVCAAGW